MTLHSPEMSETITRIVKMLIGRGVSIECGKREEYSHGAFSMEIKIGGRDALEIAWSHVEQRVFLYWPAGRAKRGQFNHVSQVSNQERYWGRISGWINKHINFSAYKAGEQSVMSEPKSNRGGSRPGAGRKPVSGVTRTSRTIDLTPLVWEFLTAGGNTAASEIEARIRATKAFKDWKKSQGK